MKPGKNVRRYVGRKQQDSAASPEYFLTHAVPRSKPYPYASKRQNERNALKYARTVLVFHEESEIPAEVWANICPAKIVRFTCPAQKQLTA